MHIFVDADACPVKKEIIETARPFRVPVVMVASHAHRISPEPGVTVVQVDRSNQSADLYIANHVKPGDVLVTQDFGLASIGLSRRSCVLSYRGQTYSEETIGFLLERSHFLSRQRRGGMRLKGPKAMTREDRMHFQLCLTKILTSMQEIGPP